MKRILEQAAQMANNQLRVQSLADRRPEGIVRRDRKSWEWATLRPENDAFDAASYVDLDARGKWFWQATFESPAMFRRKVGLGSVYVFAARDKTGACVDGGKAYKLTVPQPVPANLFWSVTLHEPETRSEVQTDQGKAALRRLFELNNASKTKPTDLYFGPSTPSGHEGGWIKPMPGNGWFADSGTNGPEQPAFDGSWKPGDSKRSSSDRLRRLSHETATDREGRSPERTNFLRYVRSEFRYRGIRVLECPENGVIYRLRLSVRNCPTAVKKSSNLS
jgi:hypothetical protein